MTAPPVPSCAMASTAGGLWAAGMVQGVLWPGASWIRQPGGHGPASSLLCGEQGRSKQESGNCGQVLALEMGGRGRFPVPSAVSQAGTSHPPLSLRLPCRHAELSSSTAPIHQVGGDSPKGGPPGARRPGASQPRGVGAGNGVSGQAGGSGGAPWNAA